MRHNFSGSYAGLLRVGMGKEGSKGACCPLEPSFGKDFNLAVKSLRVNGAGSSYWPSVTCNVGRPAAL
jgi:hypothetical protein